jgi:signal transduction histidine kinase
MHGSWAEPELSEAARTLQAESGSVLRATRSSALRLAWPLWALCVALVASALVLDLLTPNFLSPRMRPAASLAILFGLLSLVSATLGALLASRLPGNRVGWVLCGMGLVYGLQRFAASYADYALIMHPSLPLGEQAAWLATWPRLWGLMSCVIVLTMLFPSGRLSSHRWRPVVWAVVCGASLLAFGDAFRAGPLLYYVDNPFGIAGEVGGLPAYEVFEASSAMGGVVLLAACLAALGSLLLRLFRAVGEERTRLKWLAYAGVPALIGSSVVLLDWAVEKSARLLLDGAAWPGLWITGGFARAVGVDVAEGRVAEMNSDMILETLVTFALLSVPLCTTVAVLKYRLYGMDFATNRVIDAPAAQGSRLRWLRVLVASLIAGFLPFAFVYLAVYAFVLAYTVVGNGVPDDQWLGKVAAFASGWGARFFFLMATLVLAWWAARGAWERVTLHGILVGLFGALVSQAMVRFFFPPVTLTELSVYVAFGVAGGGLGGMLGRASLTGEVYRASRQIGAAKDPDTVAAALGEHLGGPDVCGVTLWRYALQEAEEGEASVAAGQPTRGLELWGSWGHGSMHLAGEFRDGVLSVLGRLDRDSSAAIRPSDLPASQRAFWERAGVRSALLIPLSAPGEAWRGVAVVTFGNRRRFSRNELRAYLTISAQAALVLENLRLVDEASIAGRQTGILVERQRMAHEIHDTLAQGFASVIMSLSAAEMSRGTRDSHGEWSRHLEEARRTARESLTEARRLVWALRPESLDRRSLPEVLEMLASEWTGDTGIETHVTTSGDVCPLRPEAEVALLRAAQESLANVRKHARANCVNITLSYIGDCVVLDVHDDGVGFDALLPGRVLGAQDTGGFGLKAMRERVERLGGTLHVESAPGEGSTIVVELPLATDNAQDIGSAEEVRDA